MTLLFKGIIIIFGLKIISNFFGLVTINFIMNYIIEWGPLAIVIIFQPEIRNVLESIGRSQLLGRHKVLTVDEREKIVYEIVNTMEKRYYVEDSEYFWKKINKMSDGQENYVIFHVQMLTTGIDLPSVNSIVILGDKNETDLFQSIMRGCRVDWNNPEKKDYEVYCYVDGETRSYMENFINTIDKIGGPELIDAFSNDVLQGETTHENNPLFTEILKTKAGYKKVIEDYKKIVNCAEYHNRADRMAALQVQLMTYMSEGKLDAFYQLQAMMRAEM